MRAFPRQMAVGLMLLLLAIATPTRAFFLDKGRNFDVRARVYTQVGIMTESSERSGCPDPTLCPPNYSAGDIGQHRTFYNPEFDARLTDYTGWMKNVPGVKVVAPDEFKFRFAWWGFYDGLYDYLDGGWGGPWNDHRQAYKTRFSQSDDPARESFSFNDENKNPRHIYASRNRINELYLDYTKGRVFFRVGRQAISWGEADTIALLDVSNPFDLTLGAPGFFQDVDEARIPLWTLRSTVKLVDQLGPLSSIFADVYMVPGIIDTTVPIDPIAAGISPFNPDQADPNINLEQQGVSSLLHTVVVARQPERTWANTRWGARLTGVVGRDYTVQGWFFRTFNQAPVPFITNVSGFDLVTAGKTVLVDDRGFRVGQCNNGVTPGGRPCSRKAPVVNLLERRLESVIGVSATWFSQPVNGIIRAEAEYFVDELGFIPERNLNPRAQLPSFVGARPTNSIPKADYIRWVLAYDRFFFFRPLNPSNSFTWITSFNSSFNLDEKGGMDFRNALAKPGKPQVQSGPIAGNPTCQGAAARTNPLCVQVKPRNFEDAYQYEGFVQTVVRTDYMHGKLQPQIVAILDFSGIFAFAPSVTYRVTDNFLLGATYLAISSSRKSGIATFRAHDMVQVRATFQLN